ncbi:glycosyltransferase family 4 protein [Thermodesulfobacteriota bacterium]
MKNNRQNKNTVLILTSTFPRWDNDTDPPFVFDLCRRLKKKYSVTVLCPHAAGTKKNECFHGITVKRFRYFFTCWQTLAYAGGILNRLKQNKLRYFLIPFFMIGELIATVGVLRREHVSVINAHWLIPQGLVAVCARYIAGKKVPLVCTLHGGDIFALNGFCLNFLKKFLLSQMTAVNVVSEAMRKTVEELGVARDRVWVIPMGVDLRECFVPPESRRPSDKTLLFVGRFVEKKGLTYLIDALPQILQKHPDATCTIVGHGPDEESIKKRIAELKLEQHIVFAGAVVNEKLPAVYQGAEIVIFPSVIAGDGDMEGFGLVLVEALGCECAVISSDLPAIHDIVTHNQTGIIVDQKNSTQIAGAVIELLDRRDLQRNLAQQGRRYVLDRYDWEITAEKYDELFRAAASQLSPSSENSTTEL